MKKPSSKHELKDRIPVQEARVIFTDLSDRFLVKFVTSIVRSLDTQKLITIKHNGQISDETIGKIYDICFSALASIEDHGGVVVKGQRYLAQLAFASDNDGSTGLIVTTDRTALHGRLEDDLIVEAISLVEGDL